MAPFQAFLKKLKQATDRRGGSWSIRDEAYYQAIHEDESLYEEIHALDIDIRMGVAVRSADVLNLPFPEHPTFARVKKDMKSSFPTSNLSLRRNEFVEVLTPDPRDHDIWTVRRTLPPYETAAYEESNLILLSRWLTPIDSDDINFDRAEAANEAHNNTHEMTADDGINLINCIFYLIVTLKNDRD